MTTRHTPPDCVACGLPVVRDGVVRKRDGQHYHLQCWNDLPLRYHGGNHPEIPDSSTGIDKPEEVK